jgi:hypothetical protein
MGGHLWSLNPSFGLVDAISRQALIQRVHRTAGWTLRLRLSLDFYSVAALVHLR